MQTENFVSCIISANTNKSSRIFQRETTIKRLPKLNVFGSPVLIIGFEIRLERKLHTVSPHHRMQSADTVWDVEELKRALKLVLLDTIKRHRHNERKEKLIR